MSCGNQDLCLEPSEEAPGLQKRPIFSSCIVRYATNYLTCMEVRFQILPFCLSCSVEGRLVMPRTVKLFETKCFWQVSFLACILVGIVTKLVIISKESYACQRLRISFRFRNLGINFSSKGRVPKVLYLSRKVSSTYDVPGSQAFCVCLSLFWLLQYP